MSQLLLVVLFLSAAATAATQAEQLLQSSGLSAAAGDWKKSLELATQAASTDPAEPRSFLQWAVAAQRLGRHQESAAAAGRALDLGFRKPAAYLARGEALLGLGDLKAALADAEAALQLNPSSEQAHSLRARVRQALGEPPLPKRRSRTVPVLLASLAVVLASILSWRRSRKSAAARGGSETLRDLMRRRGCMTPLTILRVTESSVGGLEALRGNVTPETLLSDKPSKIAGNSAAYWPPERESGSQATAAGDLYSLAGCLYEALTGRLPFSGPEALVDKRMGRLTPPSRHVPGLAGGIDAFFVRALNPEPGRRFQAKEELLNALRAAVAPPVE